MEVKGDLIYWKYQKWYLGNKNKSREYLSIISRSNGCIVLGL